MEQSLHLTPDLQHYYESSFDMMASKGWKYLMEDLEKLKSQVENIRTVTDAHSLHYRQGQLDILELLLNRKNACEEVWKGLQDA